MFSKWRSVLFLVFLLAFAGVVEASPQKVVICGNDNGIAAKAGDSDCNEPIMSGTGLYPIGPSQPMPPPFDDPFWNSADGPGLGVGFHLTCTGAYVNDPSCPGWDPANIVYFASGMFSVSGVIEIDITTELSAYASTNKIWLYDGAITHLLVDGPNSAGDSFIYHAVGSTVQMVMETQGGNGFIGSFVNTPEPGSWALIGAGLIGLGWIGRRSSRSS